MNAISSVPGDKLAKDTFMTNLSTWMVLVDQPELEERLLPLVGTRSIPISLKLSSFGNEFELQMYTNSTLNSLLDQAAALSGKDVKSIKLKHVEEHQTRRLDLLLYEKSTETLPVEMRVLNTL